MKKFKNFYIEEFKIEKNNILFNFSFDKQLNFQEKIHFNISEIKIDNNIKNLLINLSIALGISYFKLYPFAQINLPINLDENQLEFRKKFYINGLGEFFFQNNIEPKINFINSKEQFNSKLKKNISTNKALLLWGGGKDSIVSYSIIKGKYDFSPFIFGKMDKIKEETLEQTGKKEILVKRNLDPQLFELNKIYYNGHVPITGIISFVSLLTAYLYNYKYIFTSNEKSASEENTIRKGKTINHQYSKSKQFEDDFNRYIKDFIEDIEYKSLLSNMYEIDIAKIFAKQKKFFPYFSSCNRNFAINKKQNQRWCKKCEKCAFVFLILSPFLEEKELIKIFGGNLFEDKKLLNTYKKLVGKKIKPFECVGTYEESKKAFKNILEKKNGEELPIILKEIKKIL